MTLKDYFALHRCDKLKHGYHDIYEPHFENVRNEPLTILEVGVWNGNSIRVWLDYFPNATIYGLDNGVLLGDLDDILANERFHFVLDDSITTRQLDGLQFDFIIDDGSHILKDQRDTFKNLNGLLKDDGVYFIEDIFEIDEFEMEELQNPWLIRKQEMFTAKEFKLFLGAFEGFNLKRYSNRKIAKIDSCIFEVTK